MTAKPPPATEDAAEEACTLPTSPTKRFLSTSAGALAGFFNRITHGVLGENMAPNVASMREHHGEDDLQVTGKKRGREQGEKGSEDEDTNGDDEAEDIQQLVSLGARSGYSADMDCDGDVMEVDDDTMEEDGGYVQVTIPPELNQRRDLFLVLITELIGKERGPTVAEKSCAEPSPTRAGKTRRGPSLTSVFIPQMTRATEQFDFTIGDGNRVRPNEGEEKEKEGDLGSVSMGTDSDSRRVVSKESGAGGEGGSSNIDACIADDWVAEQLDSAVGDSTGVALGEGKEREEEGSGSDVYPDMNPNSSSADKDDGGMSNDGMLGNTFQLTDVEISNMPEQAEGLCQAGDPMAAGGKDKDMNRFVGRWHLHGTPEVATFGPKRSHVEGASNVKGKKKVWFSLQVPRFMADRPLQVPAPNPLAFSRPLEYNFFTPSPLIPDQPLPRPSGAFTTGCQAEHGDTTSQHPQPKARNDESTRLHELRDLQDSIESNIRANIWQELGKVVESSVAVALEKALPDLLNQSPETSAGTSSPQTSKATSKKTKKLPKPRTPSHNEFKKSIWELGKELLRLEDHKELPQSVGQREIGAWDSKQGPCCTVEDFHIDLEGLPRSEWNKSAALVFATEYLRRHRGHQGENLTLEYVSQVWLTHVLALRTRYKDKQRDDFDRKEHKARNRWRQRKHELYTRRLQTAYEYKEIKDRTVVIVESLGQDGHCGEATYHILDKDWRSKQIPFTCCLRYNSKWQATAGAWPHFRTTSLNESKGSPVQGLPIDFYCRNWYWSSERIREGATASQKPVQHSCNTIPVCENGRRNTTFLTVELSMDACSLDSFH
ncbi:hypothetical protein EDD16DRAFT_1528847 [Pisolithus croceorrhizus]|nr:hypothetical protein EDD16DRAFT_1528847 [Pisolithus croceorrhizus]